MKIIICDECLRRPMGCPVTSISVGGRVFEVCAQCEDKPFRIPPPVRAMVMLLPGATGVEVAVSAPVGGP